MVRGGLQRIWPIVPRIWQETGRNQNSERNQHVPLIDSKAPNTSKEKSNILTICRRYTARERQSKQSPYYAGGDWLDYYGETSTETTSLETAKILINSVLSTTNARFMTIHISNFCIQTDLPEYQYMRFHRSIWYQSILLTNTIYQQWWTPMGGAMRRSTSASMD